MNVDLNDGERTDMKARARGFTLIELMIVIAIIAILAAILIPNFAHARAESQTAACEDNEKSIATAMEEYSVDNNGQYTTTLPSSYLVQQPKDPVNGALYIINATASPAFGSYQVSDTGGHDKSTMNNLTQAGGTACGTITCSTVMYSQNSGLIGK
jgi:prepilin-type N-terminal cleavage/methylation domain-containing protein